MNQFFPKRRVCEDSHSPGGASSKASSKYPASSQILSEKAAMSNRPPRPACAFTRLFQRTAKKRQSRKLGHWTKLSPQEDIARQV